MSIIVLLLIEFVFDKPIPWWIWLATFAVNTLAHINRDNSITRVKIVPNG